VSHATWSGDPLGLHKGIEEELSAALWNTNQRMSCGAMLSGPTALDLPAGSAIRSKTERSHNRFVP
jgi:hypothetical protein